ncbi:hypothetical protein BH24ACT5_BH24ACT5_22740 [soil metagenome]
MMIDDHRVISMDVIDCGEPLVDARAVGLRTAVDHPRATSPADTRFWCRESVLTLLKSADDALLDGVDLVLA